MAPRKSAAKPEVAASTNSEVAASAPESAAAPLEAPAKLSKTAVTVKYRDHAGNPTERTFSKEVHGDDFAKLAAEFIRSGLIPFVFARNFQRA